MQQQFTRLIAAGLLAVAAAGSARAHAFLEITEAPANSGYKAVVAIPHGCEGKPTQAVRVRIPEGVIVAKPMPKPGWQLATSKGAYAKSYDYYGTPVAEGVTEIAWTGATCPTSTTTNSSSGRA
jgi:periplasmic copper chaperone A